MNETLRLTCRTRPLVIVKISLTITCCFLFLTWVQAVFAQEELAKQSQNPLGTIISAPFENNVYFGIGPSDSTAYVLNLKPVYPINLGNLNLINRLILPIIYSEGQDAPFPPGMGIDSGYAGVIEIAQGSAFGLGDMTYQGFLGPAKPGKLIWGVGPALMFPTATEDRYASDKWSAGPSAVVLTMPGKWVLGVLAQNVWSFAGQSTAPDVNRFLFQYFINYNIANGWYLSTTPIITANWEASGGNKWTVPLGGGAGRLVRFGKLPVDFKLAGYWNAEKPAFGPDWNLQFTVKFLFPKGKPAKGSEAPNNS